MRLTRRVCAAVNDNTPVRALINSLEETNEPAKVKVATKSLASRITRAPVNDRAEATDFETNLGKDPAKDNTPAATFPTTVGPRAPAKDRVAVSFWL